MKHLQLKTDLENLSMVINQNLSHCSGKPSVKLCEIETEEECYALDVYTGEIHSYLYYNREEVMSDLNSLWELWADKVEFQIPEPEEAPVMGDFDENGDTI
jgi:hypothetical protein